MCSDHGGQPLGKQVIALPKLSSNLHMHPVPPHNEWKYLSQLSLADPDMANQDDLTYSVVWYNMGNGLSMHT